MKRKNKKDSQIRFSLILSQHAEEILKETFVGKIYIFLEALEKKITYRIRDIKSLREESEIIQYINDLNDGFITSSECQGLIEEMLKTGESQIEDERKIINLNEQCL